MQEMEEPTLLKLSFFFVVGGGGYFVFLLLVLPLSDQVTSNGRLQGRSFHFPVDTLDFLFHETEIKNVCGWSSGFGVGTGFSSFLNKSHLFLLMQKNICAKMKG